MFDQVYKDKIGKQIVLKISQGLKEGQLTTDDASEASTFLLDNIDKITTQSELFEFLTRLSKQWPVFSQILVIELGQAAKAEEQQKTTEVEKLISENKIDEAIQTANQAISKDKKEINGGS